MTKHTTSLSLSNIWQTIKQSLDGEQQDYTEGSIRKAIFLLAIPMILELSLESVFAVADIFFVSKLGANAIATVGLTESGYVRKALEIEGWLHQDNTDLIIADLMIEHGIPEGIIRYGFHAPISREVEFA